MAALQLISQENVGRTWVTVARDGDIRAIVVLYFKWERGMFTGIAALILSVSVLLSIWKVLQVL